MGSTSSLCSLCNVTSSTVSPSSTGPSEWGKAFPIAVTGTRQSPIDIKPDACKICNKPSDEKLIISYPSSISGCTIKNSGYGWTVNIANALDTNANVTGNPLKNETYVLEQFHAHWGCNDTCGSEHTIAGKAFSAELHLVHWNKDRFASFAEAAKNDHGLAVVAIFLESTDDTNEINKNSTLNNLCEKLTDVPFKGDSVDFKADVKLSDLLPNGKLGQVNVSNKTTNELKKKKRERRHFLIFDLILVCNYYLFEKLSYY